MNVTSNDLQSVILRRKNAAIIMVEKIRQDEAAEKEGHGEPPKAEESLLTSIDNFLTQEDIEIWNQNPPVSLPAIKHQLHAPMYSLVDPRKTGSALPLQTYFYYWMRFIVLSWHGNDYPLSIIGHILEEGRQTHSRQELLSLVDLLWRDRWIIDYMQAGKIRLSVVARNPDELRALMDSESYPNQEFAELERRLADAKESSQSVDEWLEALYSMSPLVHQLYMMYLGQPSEEGQKRHRFIDEVGADIGSVIMHCMHEHAVEGTPLVMSRKFLLEPIAEHEDLRELKRALSYKYRARVFYPRFWYESAMEYVTSDRQSIPEGIDRFDPFHLYSIALTYSLDAKKAFLGLDHPR